MNSIIITQSNYIPWKGFFRGMINATHFVYYDEMQYTKRDWRNRNILISEGGPKWITIPVKTKGNFFQKISDVYVSDKEWGKNHWNFIENNYKSSPFFETYKNIFQPLYLNPVSENLSEINLSFIKVILSLLEIDIKIISSKEFKLKGDKTEKLLNICKELNADNYITGSAAKNYINSDLFESNSININYLNYNDFKEYKQNWNGFDHNVSILDMFFNLGYDTIKHLKL